MSHLKNERNILASLYVPPQLILDFSTVVTCKDPWSHALFYASHPFVLLDFHYYDLVVNVEPCISEFNIHF